jgi:hypothetical protein
VAWIFDRVGMLAGHAVIEDHAGARIHDHHVKYRAAVD